MIHPGGLVGMLHQGPSKWDSHDYLGPNRDGYVSLDGERARSYKNRRRRYLNALANFGDMLAIPKVTEGRNRPLTPYQENVLVELVRYAHRHGVQIIYPLPPRGVMPDPYMSVEAAYTARRLPVPMLNYQNPRQHPDLFDSRLWFDKVHMSDEGARLLSRRIAEGFLALANQTTSP